MSNNNKIYEVHKHNPVHGNHLCGAPVPKEFRWRYSWIHSTNTLHQSDNGYQIRQSGPVLKDIEPTEQYLSGAGLWCCENSDNLVTCKACLRILGGRK